MKTLYMLIGLPGAGKSTWLKTYADNGVIVSRDAIRFAMIGEDEPYFSKETEVFNRFIEIIQECIDDEYIENIYIDATHVTKAGRNKVLNCLNLDKVDKKCAVLATTPLHTCLLRNSLREGRERVPESAINNMALSFEWPKDEFDEVITF